jgi:alpha-galactosidase
MEKICPDAWLINFTNPMIRICDAVHRYSRIKVVGLCHQIMVGYALVGMALAKDLEFDIPPGITGSHADPFERHLRRQVSRQAFARLNIQAAGINHFTWMLSLEDRLTGEDLYPLFRKRWNELPFEFEPLTRKIFEIFDLFPIPGDEHLCEYLPWVSDPATRPWEKYKLSLYDWEAWAQLREDGFSEITRLESGEQSMESLKETESEGAVEVIENISQGGFHIHPAYNLPNKGQIANLPLNVIVETPGIVNDYGIQPRPIGDLPGPIAELCRRELAVVQLSVDAAVKGDRRAALQCLLLDPVIRDMDVAKKILDDYLNAYRDFLPQFWED